MTRARQVGPPWPSEQVKTQTKPVTLKMRRREQKHVGLGPEDGRQAHEAGV